MHQTQQLPGLATTQPIYVGNLYGLLPLLIALAVDHRACRGLAGCGDELGMLLTVGDDVGQFFQGPVRTSK